MPCDSHQIFLFSNSIQITLVSLFFHSYLDKSFASQQCFLFSFASIYNNLAVSHESLFFISICITRLLFTTEEKVDKLDADGLEQYHRVRHPLILDIDFWSLWHSLILDTDPIWSWKSSLRPLILDWDSIWNQLRCDALWSLPSPI